MSEKIYVLLFRLFPSRFRALWQDDALELIRNRARDERGLIPRLRLWFDLLADAAVSLPRTYLNDTPDLVPAPQNSRNGIPSFQTIEDKPIRSSAFFYGTVLSIFALAIVSLLAKHAGHFPIRHAGSAAEASGVTMDPWATGTSGGDGSGDTAIIGNGAGSAQPASAAPGNPTKLLVRRDVPHLVFFDAAERHRVVNGIILNLDQHYPDATLARQLGHTLQARERSGDYDSIDDPRAFASLLTHQLRSAGRDSHFEVIYSQVPLHEPTSRSEVEIANYVAIMRQANCTFDKVTILPHNIGYLKLDSFPDPEACGDRAIAAMKTLSRANALIIDLRDNSGGSPAMVLFLAGWLFDRPAFFYDPRESDAARMWTNSPMAGSGLAHKPVWVLTSSRTWSAAEQFSYNLKMLHRATLVGETTGGATDVGMFRRIDDHFGIGLRESKVRNPYPAPDWAVTGVQPDIRVPAADALTTAEKLAVPMWAHR